MITLIGFRCTHRKVFSREVLIDRVVPTSQCEGKSRGGASHVGQLENRNNLLLILIVMFVNFVEEEFLRRD